MSMEKYRLEVPCGQCTIVCCITFLVFHNLHLVSSTVVACYVLDEIYKIFKISSSAQDILRNLW